TTVTFSSHPLNKGDKDKADAGMVASGPALSPEGASATHRPDLVRATYLPEKGDKADKPDRAPSPTAIPPAGCPSGPGEHGTDFAANEGPIPTELAKVSMPAYVIEPPDILLLDPIRLVPRPPYRLEPLDQLLIQVSNALQDQPISGVYV